MFVMALKNGERKMNQFVPKLFDCMKSYTKEQFAKDVISGIIVAIIALPLSIALALASGVGPEQGIYTAIFAGFVISFLGGSNVQIAGPTAAFATIVAGIVARNGMSGLAADYGRYTPYYNGLFKAWQSDKIYSLYNHNRIYIWYCCDHFGRPDKGLSGAYIY